MGYKEDEESSCTIWFCTYYVVYLYTSRKCNARKRFIRNYTHVCYTWSTLQWFQLRLKELCEGGVWYLKLNWSLFRRFVFVQDKKNLSTILFPFFRFEHSSAQFNLSILSVCWMSEIDGVCLKKLYGIRNAALSTKFRRLRINFFVSAFWYFFFVLANLLISS